MIGSGLVRYLNDLGYNRLFLVDDLGAGEKWKNLLGKSFIELISPQNLFDFLKTRGKEIDAVVHLGACSDTTETNGDYLMENNVRFSIRLAEWTLSHNKRFIYASSAATYGDGSLGFSDDEALLEDLRPLNLYGFSKHLVDLWMKRENVLSKVVGLKYFNVFGPNEYHKAHMSSFVCKMVPLIQNQIPIKLFKSNDPLRFADGEQSRDFIYLKDAVKMTSQFLFSPGIGGIYNIGLGIPTSWNQLARHLFASLQKDPSILYIDMPKELDRQYQNYTCADMSKFHKIFPGTPFTPMQEAVREYVNDYLVGLHRW